MNVENEATFYICNCKDNVLLLLGAYVLIISLYCTSVVHVCEDNFASGASIYLDTFKAVNYEGNCACQLKAHGGAVDLQLSVQGVHKDCDATLYFPPPIDYTYKCADKTSSNTTGRIGPGQVVFLTLIKRSEVTDFCVHLVQISSAGKLTYSNSILNTVWV